MILMQHYLTNFKSTFNFIKETGIMGDQNF